MTTNRLPTALQIASRRAKAIARATFETRLDPAAYRCTRDGRTWIAEGAGQRFEYSLTEWGTVLVMSHTGGIYALGVGEGGALACDCPSAARNGGTDCKHLRAFEAVRMARRMERATALTESERDELLSGALEGIR